LVTTTSTLSSCRGSKQQTSPVYSGSCTRRTSFTSTPTPPSNILHRDSETCRATTIDDWLSILDLSTKYQIDDVRNLATARLHALPVDPIRRILIWKKYYLPKHLLACSYVELCQRSEPLSLGETRLLGLEMFTLVAAARDIFHRCTGCGCRRRSSREKQAVAEEVVKNVFFKSTVLQQRSR
jgi:hypothetical protein